MPSVGKSSHGLLSGELKMGRKRFEFTKTALYSK